jgi:hypothetical protein
LLGAQLPAGHTLRGSANFRADVRGTQGGSCQDDPN